MRSNTRADIVWLISTEFGPQSGSPEAIALTPGGGKIGTLLNSAFDGKFIEIASRKLKVGRIIELEVSPFESSISGIPTGTKLKFAIVPSDLIEPQLWQALVDRESIAMICQTQGDEIVTAEIFTSATILAAGPHIVESFEKNRTSVEDQGNYIVTIYHPVTKLVIAGSGPNADAIAQCALNLGWQVAVDPRPDMFAGLTAGLSSMDCAIIMGHDVDTSAKCLSYALESAAGYIGALGSLKMQENRADWLAYRDITDLSRVHGPAGIRIGAQTPNEIAISVIAEAISVLKGV